MNDVGSKIRLLRKKLNLSQEQLSCNILNRTSLSKIENGKLIPSLKQLEHISSVLNVDIDVLVIKDRNILYNNNICNSLRHIDDLYENKNYLTIIEEVSPRDFLTYYYVGMSYYRIELLKEAKFYLQKCEKLFLNLSEDEKYAVVEKLCYALNCLRRITINSVGSEVNKDYLQNGIKYLKRYNKSKCEICYILNSNMTAYYIKNKQYEEAINFISKFLNDNKKINSLTVLPYIHLNASIAYFALKNYSKAICEINRAIFFFNYIDDTYQEGECYLNLFNYYLYNNDFPNCNKVINDLNSKCNDIRLEDRYKVLELVLLYNENKYDEIINKSRSIKLNGLIPKCKVDYYFIMGRTNFYKKRYKTSVNLYNKCIKYLESKEKYADLTIIYKDRYSMLKDYVDYEKYILYKNKDCNAKYNGIHPNITSPSNLKRLT